ncbi:MAG: hypothetical protein OIN66_15615 [Candidatus Methanoperedens sp.]|nr:hypothetical protein [Candidatus Methanoperedens sp.]
MQLKKNTPTVDGLIKFSIVLLLTILLVSNTAYAAQVLQVSSSRHSLFSPWMNKASDTSLSANFTAYALFLNTNGTPVSGANITFEIYSQSVKKVTKYNNTQQNGLASVPYDTINDFTASTDTDYGNWSIVAYPTGNPALKDKINMSIQAGGSALQGCSKDYCHETATKDVGGYPRSPYTDSYGQSNTRAEAAHTQSNHANAGCYYCHVGYAATKTGTYGYTGDVHRNRTCDFCHGTWTYIRDTGSSGGKGIPKMPSCSDCHLIFNNNLTDMNTLANLAAGNNISVYSYNYDRKAPLTAHNGTDYSLIKSVPCVVCHGPAHNNTKPDPNIVNTNNVTEYTQCISCHNSYNRHNNSVSCTVCHSQDAHSIKVFAQNATYVTGKTNPARGNCTNCHQNSTFQDILEAQPKAGGYTGRNPPQIPTPLNHSIDPYSGALWNGTQPGYWNNKSQLSACNYCHGSVLHNTSALGNISKVKGTNFLNQSLIGGSWCANCHYKNAPNYAGNQFSPQPPEVLNLNGLVPSNARDGTTFYNHSDALSSGSDDATCKGCHNNRLASDATSLNLSHNVATGSEGGRDCVSCHDKGKSIEKVDVSKMNQTDSIHNVLNNNSVIVTPGLNPDNKRCWACHTNSSLGADNVVNEAELPSSGHPNSYNVPKKCTQCHIQGNFSGLVVSEHFSGSTDIRTKFYANTNDSCVNCHNKTEMLLPNSDPSGPKSIYASVSHYGSNKTNDVPYISGSSANCSYCHQNLTSAFTTEMNDASWNSTISNHTALGTNPACINCHNSGRIHFATLTKPAVSATLCANCHTNKDKHNGSVQCSQCHMQSNRSIHPIQYLQPDATFKVNSPANKSTAINCTNCHQGAGITGFNNAPIIPDPLKHSANLSNGTIWGMYWTSEQGSCYYCHGNTKHNNTALGRINNLTQDANNTKNGALQTTTWCADCHYSDAANTKYLGSQWSPVPPTITIDNTGKNGWQNHSTYLSGGYRDSNCQTCHASNGTYTSTSLNYSHSLNEGVAGGANCVGCHNAGGTAGPGRLVNVSAMNDTNAIHKNLNRNAVTSLSAENKKCWACHGSGSEPGSGHPSNYRTPYRCADCHISGAGQNTNFTPSNILEVTQHYWNGTSIKTSAVTSCYDCHNKNEMMLGLNLDPDGAASVYGGANGGSNSTSHYGKKRSDYPVQGTNEYCYQCHSNPSTAFPFVDAANKTIANHSTNYASSPNCADCHATQAGRIHNSTLYKPAFSLPNSTFCLNCHGAGGSAAIKNKEQHNGILDCTQCHLNSTRSIHPVRYLQDGGASWDTARTNAVNCTNCHQGAGIAGFNNAPIIPDTLKHSASLSNGTTWGTYWTSEQGSCYYCHGNTKHNNTALGTINSLTLDPNNTRSGALTTTTWCADCHYSDSANANYLGSQWSPAPPAITVNNTGKSGWENHTSYIASGYKDEKCRSCHALNGAYGTTSLNYSHSLNVGISGGADCISCHYVGSSYHNIDTIAANASVHSGMNSNNATSAGFAAIDGACWACHDTDGNVTNNPSNQIMGDIYNTPKKCDDCHLASGTYYSQASGWGAPTVSEHYYSASQIKAGNSDSNIASCINCHENVSEMVLRNNDSDYGSFAGDGIRLAGGNMSFYHYGKSRSDLRTWDSGQAENCSYCHQNTSTAFAAGMLNPAYNSSIQNHSSTQASPGCYNSTCHNSGWIHNSTLTRPALNPDSAATFCQNCHTTKQKHNGTLDCSNCHINQSSTDTIHPIKFLQNSGSFDLIRTSAVNCTSCHQGAGISGLNAPKIPDPVNHSVSPSAGQKWGNYWDNTSQVTACYYCHQNEIHKINADLLGNVSTVKGSNTFNNADLANSTWCANCHYAGAQEYKGMFLPVPPPEITDASLVASDGTMFFNHSGLSNFNDSNCKACHGLVLSGYSETSLNFSHSVSVGGGGDNCIDCHGTNYIGASPSVTRTFVNISAFNESIHQDINNTPPATMENLDCWSCHYNKDMNRQNVKKCGDCHRKPSQWHGNANITTNLSELW